MLILIAGITGNLGQYLTRSALVRGHTVRGLGRDPGKLPDGGLAQLESFVTVQNFYDIAGLEKAVSGVDAVIAAYANIPSLTLEAQLVLYRAAERAGVKRYVATSWNMDWSRIPLGFHESYDEHIMFKRQIEVTPHKIKPIYIFVGGFAEMLFGAPSDDAQFSPGAFLDTRNGTAEYTDDGQTMWQWTTFHDTAEYTIEIVTGPDAEKGGNYSVMSDHGTIFEINATWESVTGSKLKLIPRGGQLKLCEKAMAERAKYPPNQWKRFIGWFYWLHQVTGEYMLDEKEIYTSGTIKPTKLKDFLEQHKEHFKSFTSKT
ncbi:hypothetical protein MMC13_006093 [Lambiella insularis]|nr:hypothetical protein [Lambiella insularis]